MLTSTPARMNPVFEQERLIRQRLEQQLKLAREQQHIRQMNLGSQQRSISMASLRIQQQLGSVLPTMSLPPFQQPLLSTLNISGGREAERYQIMRSLMAARERELVLLQQYKNLRFQQGNFNGSPFNQQPCVNPQSDLDALKLVRKREEMHLGPEEETQERPFKKTKHGNEKDEYKKPKASTKPRKNKKPKESTKPRKMDIKWLETLEQLKEYRTMHGNCIVPRGYSENPRLASWVAEQR